MPMISTFSEGVTKAQLDQILNEKLKPIGEKIDKQNDILQKIASLIIQLHQDGKLNDEILDKLDVFLKPYFENPYNDGK